MNNKRINLDLKMYYGTEKHTGHSSAWLVPAKTIYDSQTKEIKDIKEIDLFILSFDWDLAYEYVAYFLNQHLNNNINANVWAHNRHLKYEGQECFDLAKDLKNIDNFFLINDMYEMIDDIKDTIKCMIDNNFENENVKEIYKRTKAEYTKLVNFNSVKDNIISFLFNFIFKLEFMLNISKEKGIDLIWWISC